MDELQKLKTLTREEFRNICQTELANGDARFRTVNEELLMALKIIDKNPRSVSFFGSARTREDHTCYEKARNLARKIAEELNYTVITGGSLGIMEAANRGAYEGGGKSVGFNIELPEEQNVNEYVHESVDFHYFFTRKVSLAFSAEAYVFFPGGFGTLDEFFEILTLVQTKKIEQVPIILFGKEYWSEVHNMIKNLLYGKFGNIDQEDMSLYTVTDDENEIIDIIKNSPIRKE